MQANGLSREEQYIFDSDEMSVEAVGVGSATSGTVAVAVGAGSVALAVDIPLQNTLLQNTANHNNTSPSTKQSLPKHNPGVGGKKLPSLMGSNIVPTAASSRRKRGSDAQRSAVTPDDHSSALDYDDNNIDLQSNILKRLGLTSNPTEDHGAESASAASAASVTSNPDILFTAPQSEQEFSTQLQTSLSIIEDLFLQDTSHYFRYAVDPIALNLPDYHSVVKRPMDLTTLKAHIQSMTFTPPETALPPYIQDHRTLISPSPLDHLIDGVGQTIKNCYLYNPKGNPIRKDGWLLLAYFDSLLLVQTERRVNWRRYWAIDDFRAYDKIVNDKRRGPNRKSGRQSKQRPPVLESGNEHQASLSSLYTSVSEGAQHVLQVGVKKRRLNAETLINANAPAVHSSLFWSILVSGK